jgi:hypothetical protein
MSRRVRDRVEYETGSKWFADWHRDQPDDRACMIDVDAAGYCPRCQEIVYLVEATRSRTRKNATVTERLGARLGVTVFVAYYDAQRPDGMWLDNRSNGNHHGYLSSTDAWSVLQDVRSRHICADVLARQFQVTANGS